MEELIFGIPALMATIIFVILVWITILWLILPFAIFGTQPKIEAATALLKKANQQNEVTNDLLIKLLDILADKQ